MVIGKTFSLTHYLPDADLRGVLLDGLVSFGCSHLCWMLLCVPMTRLLRHESTVRSLTLFREKLACNSADWTYACRPAGLGLKNTINFLGIKLKGLLSHYNCMNQFLELIVTYPLIFDSLEDFD